MGHKKERVAKRKAQNKIFLIGPGFESEGLRSGTPNEERNA